VSVGTSSSTCATARVGSTFGIVVASSRVDEDPQSASSSATERLSRQRDTGTKCGIEPDAG
jgi:hypothetical protein